MPNRITFPCAILAIAAAACSDRQPASTDAGFAAFVDSIADAAVTSGRVPSLAIVVARGSQLLVKKAYGVSDVENDVRANSETVYRIASVSKQFTAAAILRLVEQQRLTLDDNVGEYVPQLRARWPNVTIRHLMNHTSGIQNLTDVPAFAATERLDLTTSQELALFSDKPANFAPGANFIYNNSGFFVLALVVERITGSPYDVFLRDSVLMPLGLNSTRACSDTRIVPHRARGYVWSGSQLENAPFISSVVPKGGGDLCSTAGDLVTWARALVTGRAISARSYSLMTTPGTLNDGRRVAYGLGLFLSTLGGHPELFHGGDFPGFTAFLAWYPADDITIAVLGNSTAAQLYDGNMARQLVRRLLALPGLPGDVTPSGVEELARIAGTYRAGAASVDISDEGTTLVAHSHGVWHLWGGPFVSRGNGVFAAVSNPELELHLGPAANGRKGAAPTVSFTLSGHAFGDFVRADGR